MKLTEKIEAYCEENNISRRQFATIAGLPYSTLMGLYKDSDARLSTLRAVANAMKVSLDYLCDDSMEFDLVGTKEHKEFSRLYSNLDPQFRPAVDALLEKGQQPTVHFSEDLEAERKPRHQS